MRVGAWLLASLAHASQGELAPAIDEADARDLAFVELVPVQPSPFVGQRTVVRLRFGVLRELLEVGLLQPFQQRLDLPLAIETGWKDGLGAARRVAPPGAAPDSDPDGRSYVLDELRARALREGELERDGRVYACFETALELDPLRPGELVLPAPRMRFTYATRFREDAFRGRLAEDRRTAAVAGEPLTLAVLPPPEAGRPLDFSGWVGRYSLRAELEPRRLGPGESTRLRLWIDGLPRDHGHEPPSIETPGFRVEGASAFEHGAGRGFDYRLTPLDAEVRRLPPIALVTLDPGPPPAYVTSWTQAVPIEVIGSGAGRALPLPDTPAGRAGGSAPQAGAARRLWVPALAALITITILALLWRARRRLSG